MPEVRGRLAVAMSRVVAFALLALIARPTGALADPITFAVRGSTSVLIGDFTVFPPTIVQDLTSVDEIFDADSLSLITSSLTGSGTTDGYSGSAKTLVTDSVLGAFATVTSAGTGNVNITSSGGAGYIDYFTVLLPVGSFVPMSFTLDPTYTIVATGGACGTLNASVQVGGGGSAIPTIGGLSYVDSSCNPDSLLTTIELMVPTGIPFRVLYELSASAGASFPGGGGTATVDALNSLELFADPVGNYSYETMSGNSFLSPAPVPEPAIVLTLGPGLGLLLYRRRRIR